jgi:hypothetical protein
MSTKEEQVNPAKTREEAMTVVDTMIHDEVGPEVLEHIKGCKPCGKDRETQIQRVMAGLPAKDPAVLAVPKAIAQAADGSVIWMYEIDGIQYVEVSSDLQGGFVVYKAVQDTAEGSRLHEVAGAAMTESLKKGVTEKFSLDEDASATVGNLIDTLAEQMKAHSKGH